MSEAPAVATATIDFTVSGQPVHTEITIPARPVRPVQMLPIFNRFAEIVVDIAVESSQAEGKAISCKASCGACCRQLVPLAETEAVHIADLVRDLPAERRTLVQSRFVQAREVLARSGMLERLRTPCDIDGEQLTPFGLEYFYLGIPCPFLENESCSIYEDRPISCREYLVTSPAEHCATPRAGAVQCVPLGATVSKAVKSLGGKPLGRMLPWVPLVLADEWAESHEEPAERPAPELLRTFLERLGEQGTSQGAIPAELSKEVDHGG